MTRTATGPLSPTELTDWYAEPADARDRTWVRASFISTLDGRATGPDGRSGSLNEGSAGDAAAFHQVRRWADVVVVGAGTARTEGYPPLPGTDLAVVSRTGDLPETLHEVTSAAEDDGPPPGEVVLLGGQGQDVAPEEVLSTARQHGWRRIALEGGPHLFADWLEAGLVDELCLTVRPVLAGGDGPLLVLPHVSFGALLGRPTHLLEWEGDLLVRTRLR